MNRCDTLEGQDMFPKSACTKAIPYGGDCGGKGVIRGSLRCGDRAGGYDQNYGKQYSVFGKILAFIAEPKIS